MAKLVSCKYELYNCEYLIIELYMTYTIAFNFKNSIAK